MFIPYNAFKEEASVECAYLPLVRPKVPGRMHGGMIGRLSENRTSAALKHRVCCHFDDAEQGL